jgi:hypothetical protein
VADWLADHQTVALLIVDHDMSEMSGVKWAGSRTAARTSCERCFRVARQLAAR